MAPFAGAPSNATRTRQRARVPLRLAGAASVGVLGGFVASLLRRRPPTRYATSLRQPVVTDDATATTETEAIA